MSSYSRGKITFHNTVVIDYNDDHQYSELSLAHELFHYILVLEGAKLPAPLREETPPNIKFLHSCLMNVPHHTVLLCRLRQHCYSNDIIQDSQESFPLSGLSSGPGDLYYPPDTNREWLLNRMDYRLFVSDQTADSILRPRAEDEGIADLYDMICTDPPSTGQIDHINRLSEEVIHTYQLEDYLELVDIEEYIQRRERLHI